MIKPRSFTVLTGFALLLGTCLCAQDKAGSKDHPLFTRMSGYYIANYQQSDFDSAEFENQEPGKYLERVVVEGKKTVILYMLTQGARVPTTIEVVRNHTNAAERVGGKMTYQNQDPGYRIASMKFSKGGQETWAQILAQEGRYTLTIVEKAAIEQQVTAEFLAKDLTDTGHTAVYGILFDTGKADIKPGSEGVLAEIAGLLKSKPALKLYVVGHTDNAGALEMNMRLSQARAEAVVNVLTTKHGISAPRLKPLGDGPTAPVASNSTEEGRAKNRRVELVEQ